MNKFANNTEYVLRGHPDRITDGIVETIAMSIFNLDGWDGRSAAEALYTGKNFSLGGEFKTSLSDESFKVLTEWIIRRILSKQTDQEINVIHVWQKQSEEINQGSLKGWGDNTVAFGYCCANGLNRTQAQEKLRNFGDKIEATHTKELADGKIIQIGDEISISIENGYDKDVIKDLGINAVIDFDKSGANADTGVVGRKLIAEWHGSGVPHGGGAFTGKDFTKGDKTLKLIADYIAKLEFDKANTKKEIITQASCFFGRKELTVVYSDSVSNKKEKIFSREEFQSKIPKLYEEFSLVRPSNYLKEKDIKELEKLLLRLSGGQRLEFNVW